MGCQPTKLLDERSTATTATAPRGSFKRRPTTLPIVPKMLLPAVRLGLLGRCTIPFTRCGTTLLKKLGTNLPHVHCHYQGSGGFRGTRRFIPYLRLDGTGPGVPMAVDVAYSTIIAFFLCWWLLGVLLQRMSKPRLRKRQEAHLQMVLLSEAVARAIQHREQMPRNH